MRCFIGLNFNSNALNKINNLSISLKKSGIKGNYTSKENIHLTLLFLGEVSLEKAEKIKESLERLEFSSFDITVNEITKLKDIIILKIEKSDELISLQKEVVKKVKSILPNIKEENDFYPHITLVRENKDNIYKKISVIDKVSSIILFSSERINGKLQYIKKYKKVSIDGKN